MTTLSIIVLSYNTRDLTKKCIESLVSQYKKQLVRDEFEIILVDNASTDATVSAISNLSPRGEASKSIPNLKIIENKENVGFAKGNNAGAKQAEGEYLLFLNSDTEVLDGGLVGMVDYLDSDEKIAVLGGRLLNVDGTSQPSAGKYYNLLSVAIMLLGGERLGFLRFSSEKLKNVDWVSGASMMVRKNIFEKLKGFDDNFFMYMEDMEFCFRVKKIGYKTACYPGVHITHKELGSSNRAFAIFHTYKGLLYFYKKHKGYFQYMLVKVLLTTKAIVAICIGALLGKSYLANTYRKALNASV